MGEQFNRYCDVTVQSKKLHGLDVEFRIDRSLKAAPNTCDISIYNLSADTRAFLSGVKGGVVVKISAGYAGKGPLGAEANAALGAIGLGEDPPILYLGSLRECTHLREGADIITRISSGDGDELRKTPVSFSLGPGVNFKSAVQKIIGGIKTGAGNALDALLKGDLSAAGNALTGGTVIEGFAGDELRRLLASANLEYSVQNGQLQILPIGKALGDVAVKLTPSTGLVGSPEVGAKGKLKFRALLNQQIYPGRRLQFDSLGVRGVYRCDRVVYLGQTRGNDWYADGEASPV